MAAKDIAEGLYDLLLDRETAGELSDLPDEAFQIDSQADEHLAKS